MTSRPAGHKAEAGFPEVVGAGPIPQMLYAKIYLMKKNALDEVLHDAFKRKAGAGRAKELTDFFQRLDTITDEYRSL